MRLGHLLLHNFRNYVRLEMDLPPGIAVLVGDNAQGKTNLLEAIYYLATSRSPYTTTDRELVNWLAAETEPLPYARLVGSVSRSSGESTIEITLIRQENHEAHYRKRVRLNGVPRRAMDLLGQLNVVLFLPEDIALISGPPAGRRRYLDAMLCQINPAYCRTLASYNQVVTQRNALLRDLRERGGDPSRLIFWNERLIDHGTSLFIQRQRALTALDGLAYYIHAELTDGAEGLHLRYLPSVGATEEQGPEAVTALFQKQLEVLQPREIAAGVSLIGPHRDEIRFLLSGVDAGIYGSRGQQRTVALTLKLAEVELMRRESGEYPILLLDDILSELDSHRRGFLLHRLAVPNGPQQTIITATDLHILPAEFLRRCQVWQVRMGRLEVLSKPEPLTPEKDR